MEEIPLRARPREACTESDYRANTANLPGHRYWSEISAPHVRLSPNTPLWTETSGKRSRGDMEDNV